MSKCFIEPESCCLISYRMLSCSTLWPPTLLARCGSFQWRLSTLKCLCGYEVHFHYLQRLMQNPQWLCDIPCSVIHFTLSIQVGTLGQPKKICALKFLLYFLSDSFALLATVNALCHPSSLRTIKVSRHFSSARSREPRKTTRETNFSFPLIL